jgi:hypothetical protein
LALALVVLAGGMAVARRGLAGADRKLLTQAVSIHPRPKYASAARLPEPLPCDAYSIGYSIARGIQSQSCLA